jgi:hypothetical protein
MCKSLVDNPSGFSTLHPIPLAHSTSPLKYPTIQVSWQPSSVVHGERLGQMERTRLGFPSKARFDVKSTSCPCHSNLYASNRFV